MINGPRERRTLSALLKRILKVRILGGLPLFAKKEPEPDKYAGYPWKDRPGYRIQWAGWPEFMPMPTLEEYKAADAKYSASLDPHDASDWCCGLSFVMATYSPGCWLHFFL